jgi:hypothetical protein
MTKVQQDIATRTMLPMVVPNSNGREVTYRFDPGLQALVDPGNRKKGSGMILQANSVPALIVIMTDRQSLKCYPNLHFELHTRWIPKKKSNVWSATWDGITRNYNPRSAMLPSDVIGAAASMDEAKRHLDWVSWRIAKEGASDAFDVAIEQGRMRCSALMSKLGSYQSNISLPVHYNVLPNGVGGLILDSSQEQKIIVERVSGPQDYSDMRKLAKVFIGGFPFVHRDKFKEHEEDALKAKAEAEAKETKAETAAKEAEHKKQELERTIAEAESKQKEAELKKQELEATVEEAATKKVEAESKKAEAESKKALVELKNQEVQSWQERPSPLKVPDGVNAHAMKEEAQNLAAEAQSLSTQSAILESKSELLTSASETLKTDSRTLEVASQELKASSFQIQADSQRLDTDSKKLQIESHPFVQRASKLMGELGAMGYFDFVEDRNLIITLPANRTWTLPTAVHAVTGGFKKEGGNDEEMEEAITFGTITLTDPAPIYVAPLAAAVAIPPQVSSEGIIVTLSGLNLDRVRSAYWNFNWREVEIINRGKDRLVLHIKEAPPKGTKEILISSGLAPSVGVGISDHSHNIVGSVPVVVQERALALASAAENVKPGTASVTFGGFFPAGTTASLGADSTPVKLEITEDGSKATVTLGAVFDVLVLGKPSAKIPLVFKSGKDSATVSLNYVNAKVSVVGIYPTVLPAASIPKEMNIVARFDPAYTGDAMVLVGGLSLGVHKVDASGTISIKDLSTRITPDQLEALDKKTDLVLLIGNEPYNMEKVISIVPRPK